MWYILYVSKVLGVVVICFCNYIGYLVECSFGFYMVVYKLEFVEIIKKGDMYRNVTWKCKVLVVYLIEW